MCQADGTPKRFQTELKELAIIKARKESARTGLTFRTYRCLHCRLWCITAQEKRTKKFNRPKSSERRKRAIRPQICDWENEGGSFRE